MELPLEIDLDKMSKNNFIREVKLEDFPLDLPNELKECIERFIEIAKKSFKSKEANELYEELIADIFHLNLNPKKHGPDAWNGDTKETSTDIWEFKPTRNSSASINDDSENKIWKCTSISKHQTYWLILAIIDEKKWNFSEIYKFPMDIYHLSRLDNFYRGMDENKKRIIYSITARKSISLCKEFDCNYYHWKADA